MAKTTFGHTSSGDRPYTTPDSLPDMSQESREIEKKLAEMKEQLMAEALEKKREEMQKLRDEEEARRIQAETEKAEREAKIAEDARLRLVEEERANTQRMYLPPLDASPNPSSSSVTQKRMMQQRYKSGFKLRRLNDVVEEGNAMQIEPNITQEGNLVPKSELGLGSHIFEEETPRMSAKAQLYHLCCVRHWKPPAYECRVEGPCHMKLFTVKVAVEIKEGSQITVLECFGDPQQKKKLASEQAAEAALWYLKNVGHTLQSEKASGRQGQTKPI